MSFSRELKDFVQGYQQGQNEQFERARMRYYEGRGNYYDSRAGGGGGRDQDGFAAGVWNYLYGRHDLDTSQARQDTSDTINDVGKMTPAPTIPTQAIPVNGATTVATPASNAAVQASPVTVATAAQNVPQAAYAGANIGVRTAALDTGAHDATDDTMSEGGYSRGGVVRRYEDGGAVQPDAPQASPPPQAAAIPSPSSSFSVDSQPMMAPRGAMEGSDAPPADDEEGGDILGSALHAGLTKLKQVFGLDQQGTAVGQDPELMRRRSAFMKGIGAPTDEDVAAARKAVNPDGKLTPAEENLKIMESGFQYYQTRGEADKAANLAAMMLQYSSNEAAKLGDQASKLLQKGDTQGASKMLAQAFNSIPNGQQIENLKTNDDGTVTFDQVDTKTGKVIGTHTLDGQQLFTAAMGLSNKSAYWQNIMNTASASKYAPANPKFNAALAAAQGLNPDGSPMGSTGGSARAGQQSGPSPTQPAAPPVPQGVPPQYAAMMRAGESSNNPSARNGDSVGLYQISTPAYTQVMGHPPIVNGKDERLDPNLNTQAFVKLTQANAAQFQHIFNRAPTPAELAVMHQQGATGGIALLNAAATAPNAPAAQVLMHGGTPYGVAVQRLVQNGIPGNASAAQAVQRIQGFYANKAPQNQGQGQGGGVTQAGNQPDPLGLSPALDQDKLPNLQAPQAPAQIPQPDYVHADAQALAGMSAAEKQEYFKTLAATNAQRQKQWSDQMAQAKSDYQGRLNDYKTQVQNARTARDQASAPLKLSAQDAQAITGQISEVTDDLAKDKNSAYSKLQEPTQKVAGNVAFGIKAMNPELTASDAVDYASRLLSFNVTQGKGGKPTLSVPWQAYASEKNPNAVRVVFSRTGESLLMPRNAFARVRQQVMSDAQAQMTKPPAGDGAFPRAAKSAAGAAKAVGNIVSNAVNTVGDTLSGRGLAAPGAPTSALGRAIVHPVDTAVAVAKKIPSALDTALLDRQNQ